jgi:hypothetical protein
MFWISCQRLSFIFDQRRVSIEYSHMEKSFKVYFEILTVNSSYSCLSVATKSASIKTYVKYESNMDGSFVC